MSSAGIGTWIYASFRRTKRRFQGLQRPARYSFEPLDSTSGVSSAKSALLPGVTAAASSPSPRDSLDVDEDDDVGGISNRGGSGADAGSRPQSVVDAGIASPAKVVEAAPSSIKYDAIVESEPSSPAATAAAAAASAANASSPTSSPPKSPFRKRGSKPFLSLRRKKKSENANNDKKKSSTPSEESAAAVSGDDAVTTPTDLSQCWKEKDEELERLRQEATALKMELRKSEENFKRLAQREKILRDRLAAQALHVLEKSGKFENVNSAELRPTQIVTMFEELYSQGRVDAMDALDELEELEDFEDLKTKILYSVIVLAYRAAKRSVDNLKTTIRSTLQLPDTSALVADDDDGGGGGGNDTLMDAASLVVQTEADSSSKSALTTTRNRRWLGAAKGVEDSLADWLRKTATAFELTGCLEEVEEQLHATLYDFPSLKECRPLREFIIGAIRVSWCCAVQNPPFALEYQQTEFKPEIHQRFLTADPDNDKIFSYVWPGLYDDDDGGCLVKGVVVT